MVLIPLPRISPLGNACLLLEAPGPFTLGMQQRIWAVEEEVSRWPEVRETCPGVTNLLVLTHDELDGMDILARRLEQTWAAAGASLREARLIRIPVVYDGPDLTFVSESCGLSVEEVVRRHSGRDHVVFAMGSHPGFGYIGSIDERLALPRRAVPRISMPAGSVAIAGMQTGVSASDGPTGWHVIGRTRLDMFDATRSDPALLRPGDIVRFIVEQL